MATKKKSVKKPEVQLGLSTAMVEVGMIELSKKEYQRYLTQIMDNGSIDDDDMSELEDQLLDSIEFCSPIFDDVYEPRLIVDEIDKENIFVVQSKELRHLYDQEMFDAKLIAKTKLTVTKKPTNYYMVRRLFHKTASYTTTIKGDFDISKLKMNVFAETCLRTEILFGYEPTYDGQDFEFEFAEGANFSTWYLLTSDGKCTVF